MLFRSLPYFHQGDINNISLFNGPHLPARLTISGDEAKTFEEINIKPSKLRDAYKNYIKNVDTSTKFDEGRINLDEAVDLFEGLEVFDEKDFSGSDSIQSNADFEHHSNLFIRPLIRVPKKVYLRMRIILDPRYPGGYRAESPFDFDGIDDDYFLRQIQWLTIKDTTFIGEEKLGSFLNKEIRKISPTYKISDKDFGVFVLEKIPLLKTYKDIFPIVYEDMSRIYTLMQRQNILLEQENIVNHISRRVIESLFNAFFKKLGREKLRWISGTARSDLYDDGYDCFIRRLTRNTELDPLKVSWNFEYTKSALGRLERTHGNSIVEKFINVVAVAYYIGTKESKKLLTNKGIQRLYDLTHRLNQIRLKVSHDTNERFDQSDYEYYMAIVFELINGLLEAYRED